MEYVTEIDDEIVDEIKQSIVDRRFKYIKFGVKIVGFGTWKYFGKNAFINRLYVEPEYRGKISLLKILKEWVDENNITEYSWKNRRRNHYKGDVSEALALR